MKVLVTGANGFVGRALCSQLSRQGYEVRGSVRGISPVALPATATTVVVGEAGPATDWTAAVAGADAVLHLAARVHLLGDAAAGALAEYRRVNVEGTRSLAVAALRAGVRRLVFLSSVKVHGERSGRPFTESDVPHPESPYAVSSLEAEQAVQAGLSGGQNMWTVTRT